MGKRGGLWMEKREGYRGSVMGGKRVMVKGGKKGEGYEWDKWGWLLVGKRVGKEGRFKGGKIGGGYR